MSEEFRPGTWYPIDSAPKDGTVVDLWRYHWVHWDQTKPEVRKEGERVVECSFVRDKWYATREFSLLENRWFDWRRNRDRYPLCEVGLGWVITHWTPIPSSPEAL
jgi:hypothetical protein